MTTADLELALKQAKSMVRTLHGALRDVEANRERLFESLCHWRAIERQHELALADERGLVHRVERKPPEPRTIDEKIASMNSRQLDQLIESLEEMLDK